MIIKINKKIETIASEYFEKSKKHREKAKKIERILKQQEKKKEELKKKIEKEKQKSLEKEKEILEKKEKREKKKWYHKYRWFLTTNNILVIGGKDASSNEAIIKKHTLPEEDVLHCELTGSPFIVIKGKANEKDIEEAANFAVTMSKAWKEKIYSYPVALIKGNQLSKRTKSGEYIKKGAFVIKGKTKTINGKLDLAIGIFEGFPMAGPERAIKKHCKRVIKLVPGNKDKNRISKELSKILKISEDEIRSILPSGGFEIWKNQ